MSDELTPLEEYNRRQTRKYYDRTRKRYDPNGLACPDCGNELVDIDKNVQLMSSPPKIKVKCLNCDFVGFRIA
jgi:transposase